MKNRTPDMENLDPFILLCDVIYRAEQGWPVESYKTDACPHTSDYARAAAHRIWDALGLKTTIGECGAPENA